MWRNTSVELLRPPSSVFKFMNHWRVHRWVGNGIRRRSLSSLRHLMWPIEIRISMPTNERHPTSVVRHRRMFFIRLGDQWLRLLHPILSTITFDRSNNKERSNRPIWPEEFNDRRMKIVLYGEFSPRRNHRHGAERVWRRATVIRLFLRSIKIWRVRRVSSITSITRGSFPPSCRINLLSWNTVNIHISNTWIQREEKREREQWVCLCWGFPLHSVDWGNGILMWTTFLLRRRLVRGLFELYCSIISVDWMTSSSSSWFAFLSPNVEEGSVFPLERRESDLESWSSTSPSVDVLDWFSTCSSMFSSNSEEDEE